jgi:hypothetical protein
MRINYIDQLSTRIHIMLSSFTEITTSYFELAKVNHPDHGGEEAVFMSIHKAYREVKKSVKGGAYDFEEAELSNRVPPEDAELFFGCDDETSYWNLKKEKIRALLGEQKFAIKGKDKARYSGRNSPAFFGKVVSFRIIIRITESVIFINSISHFLHF